MTQMSGRLSTQTSRGVALTSLGYALFTIQDAIVKWLVADYSIFQVLFARSLVVLLLSLAIGGCRSVAVLRDSKKKLPLVFRALLMFAAFILFYSAARHLGLAELTAIYFVAPVIIVVLSVFVLKETVGAGRWLAVLIGFAGVLVAAKPSDGVAYLSGLMALGAAGCWALSTVLIRLISHSETTSNQMLVSNGVFALSCAIGLAWGWKTPDGFSAALMAAVGLAGGLGQLVLYEGFRHAPASLIAPTEYTSFIWAFLLGYVVWGDVPNGQVWAGAGMIIGSGVLLLWIERCRLVGIGSGTSA
jgi:S-adenosylmethionine uptake transporter